jgi:hypothetical protein
VKGGLDGVGDGDGLLALLEEETRAWGEVYWIRNGANMK